MAGTPRAWILVAAVLAVVATAYSGVLGAPFAWDDRLLVLDQEHGVSPLVHLSRPFWRPSAERAEASYYRPLVSWSHALDWHRGDGKPGPFHTTNLLLHLSACLLLYAVARRGGAQPLPSALGAALFGLTPRLTESVAWVSGRTDVLAGLFVLLALLAHRSGPKHRLRRWAAGACILAALLSKEVGLAGLVAIAAGEWAEARRGAEPYWRRAPNLLPGTAAVASYALLRWALAGGPGLPPGWSPPGIFRLLFPLQALGTYCLMLADPLRPRLLIGVAGDVEPHLVALGGAVAALAVALGVRLWQRPPDPAVARGLALAGASLFPVLRILPLNLSTVAADRFLYLPVAGLALAGVAMWAPRPTRTWRAAGAIALALATAFAVATAVRVRDWTDELRLWSRAAETTSPRNPVARIHLGNVLQERGRLAEAVAEQRRALAEGGGRNRREALAALGSALSDLGRFDEGREAYREALALGGGLAVDHYNLAIVEARALRFDVAEQELRAALATTPDYAEAREAQRFVAESRAAWLELPAETPDEAPPVRARRAAFWSRLGVPSRAAPLWRAVLAAPGASAEELLQAASFAVRRGSPEEGRRALERARTGGVPAAELERLEALLRFRNAGGAP